LYGIGCSDPWCIPRTGHIWACTRVTRFECMDVIATTALFSIQYYFTHGNPSRVCQGKTSAPCTTCCNAYRSVRPPVTGPNEVSDFNISLSNETITDLPDGNESGYD
jgi:hypothetical protein